MLRRERLHPVDPKLELEIDRLLGPKRSVVIEGCYSLFGLNKISRSFLSPPHPSWTPCSVPTPGGCTVHFRRHVIILCNLLLNGQLLVSLILLFATDVGEASFLVFINVKDSFSWHSGPLDMVGRQ